MSTPAGSYDFTEARIRFGSNASAAWSLAGDITIGGFFNGNTKSVSSTLTNRVGSTWIGALQVRYDDVELVQGAFDTVLLSLRTAYSFTPRVFLQGLFQYNSQQDVFSGNARFGWLSTAGTGLFLVYNDTQRTIDPTGPTFRTFILKFTKQLDVVR